VIGGVRLIGSTRVAVAMLMEPVVAVVVAAVALGQRLTVLELAGGAAILVAVVLMQLRPRGSPGSPATLTGGRIRSRLIDNRLSMYCTSNRHSSASSRPASAPTLTFEMDTDINDPAFARAMAETASGPRRP